MAADAEMTKLLFKIAVAYYEDGLTQEQIKYLGDAFKDIAGRYGLI